jgi:glycerophosphoryl diester phosphodiesterase
MSSKEIFWNNFKNNSKLIVAHRGFRAIRAENTMLAFQKALGKCDFIELDVGFTKDGVAIIIHDDTLERTSNVKKFKKFKKPYNVVDYTYKQLKKLDFSSWFIRDDPFDTIKNKIVTKKELKSLPVQKILKLKTILKFCKKNNLPVNVELKDMRGTLFDKIIVKKVLKMIIKLKIENLVLLSSFNHNYIKESYKIAPNITTAILEENNHPKDIIKYMNSIPTRCYHSELNITTKKDIKKIKNKGFLINVFTVNNKKQKKELFKNGVNSIFTDFLD